jgi:3-phenylpropionate/trans-cinnamate dioxygenase ferredoxin reductase subunit
MTGKGGTARDIAIIGFGAAGYAAAKAMREAGYTGAIHVFTDSAHSVANPMLVTYYAAGKIPFEQLFPFGSLAAIAEDLNLTLHAGSPVTRLCAKDRSIETAGGQRAGPFYAILCATGARPFVPPLAHCPDQSCLYTMRTVKDARRLRNRLEEGNVRSALVVGASMAGIKAAELLSNAGARTTLADTASRIFPLAALPDIAALIEERVRARDVDLLFGHTLKEVVPCDGAYAARLENQGCATAEIKADLVCVCVGTRPNLDYIDPSELTVKPGLVADHAMRTTVPGIYAAGDCAAAENLQSGQPAIIGLWQNALLHGRAAGLAMAGRPELHSGNIFQNITHFMDMDFISFGSIGEKGELITDGGPEKGFELRAVLLDGKLACVNILDNIAVSGPIRNYMLKRFIGREPDSGCSASQSQSSAIPPLQAGLLQKCGLRPETIRRLEGAP